MAKLRCRVIRCRRSRYVAGVCYRHASDAARKTYKLSTNRGQVGHRRKLADQDIAHALRELIDLREKCLATGNRAEEATRLIEAMVPRLQRNLHRLVRF